MRRCKDAVQLLLPLFCLLLASASTADGRRALRNALEGKKEGCRPTGVEGLQVAATDNGKVAVWWNTGTPDDGCVNGYLIVTCEEESCGSVNPRNCTPEEEVHELVSHRHVTDLTPLKHYSIKVAAFKDEGGRKLKSNFTEVCITVPPPPPPPVTEMKLECSPDTRSVTATWKVPTGLDPKWDSFYLRLHQGPGTPLSRGSRVVEKKSHCKEDICSVSLEAVKGGRTYTVSVVPHIAGMLSYQAFAEDSCGFPATAPPKPTKDVTFVDSTSLKLTRTQKAFRLPLDAFSDSNGPIISYTVLVAQGSEIGSCETPLPWVEANLSDPVKCYIAISALLNPKDDSITVVGTKDCEKKGNALQCILGRDETCEYPMCNGQLKVEVKYGVIIEARTTGGSTMSQPAYFTAGTEEKEGNGSGVTSGSVLFVGAALLHNFLAVR